MNEHNSIIFRILGLIGGMAIFIIMLIPFNTQDIEYEKANFKTTSVKDSEVELGGNFVRTVGIQGLSKVEYSLAGSFLQRIFDFSSVDKTVINRTVITTPKEEVKVEGTKKFQYMYCSNNTYQHYTNEQFKDPNTGFTSKSEDYCTKSGNGAKIQLSNSTPTLLPTCIDVTSYDYNWNNDMLCTNPDGSRYYTSYAGAGR